MEEFKQIIADPVKLEACLKDTWAKIDTKGEGSVTYEQYATQADAIWKSWGMKEEKPPTEEELAQAKKIADPNGTGKVNYEGFKALMTAMIELYKKDLK